MNLIVKFGGILLIIVAFVLLLIYSIAGLTSNGLLLTSGILCVAGLLGHIILNKFVEIE